MEIGKSVHVHHILKANTQLPHVLVVGHFLLILVLL